MRRVNLEANADFIGNRPLKTPGVQLIRRHNQRRPMIDLEALDEAAGDKERHKAILEQKEIVRTPKPALSSEAVPVKKPLTRGGQVRRVVGKPAKQKRG
jgi:hypothetical protein